MEQLQSVEQQPQQDHATQLQPATRRPTAQISLQGLLAEAAAKAGQVSAAAGGGAQQPQQQRRAAASYPGHTRSVVASIKVCVLAPISLLQTLQGSRLAGWLLHQSSLHGY